MRGDQEAPLTDRCGLRESHRNTQEVITLKSSKNSGKRTRKFIFLKYNLFLLSFYDLFSFSRVKPQVQGCVTFLLFPESIKNWN